MKENSKKIAVVGDSMMDTWVHGTVSWGQEHCPKFSVEKTVRTPGGAANAARQLEHWNCNVSLIAPGYFMPDELPGVDQTLRFGGATIPIKERFIDKTGNTVFRIDHEVPNYGLSEDELHETRDLTVKAIRHTQFDAVLICDYAKGFVDEEMIVRVIRVCKEKNIPCVVDPKRSPECCRGAVIKCNDEYLVRHLDKLCDHEPSLVLTLGADYPLLFTQKGPNLLRDVDLINLKGKHLPCVNHVGAGDCFAAHLALTLANGGALKDALLLAHAAGQVYVRHEHGRPPWPHEIHRQWGKADGKVLYPKVYASDLRASLKGKTIVFTNGVFRIPHAGHAWLLDWARQLGDVLVVGINDDASMHRLRNGEPSLSLNERTRILASLQSVDWVLPFSEDDPCDTIRLLGPDILVKGHEYADQRVPGDDLVSDVRFAPESPYPNHCSDLVRSLQVKEF